MRPDLQVDAGRERVVAFAIPVLLCLVVVARAPFRHPAGGHAHVVVVQEALLALGAAVLVALAAWARMSLRRDRVMAIFGALAVLELASCLLAANGWLALRSTTLLLAGAAVFFVARSVGEPSRAGFAVALGLVAGSAMLEALGALPGLSPRGHGPGGFSQAAADLVARCP